MLSARTLTCAAAGGRKLVVGKSFSHMRPREHIQASRRIFITKMRGARRRPQRRRKCRCAHNLVREWTWTRVAAHRGMLGGIRFTSIILWRFGVAWRRRLGYLSCLWEWQRVVSPLHINWGFYAETFTIEPGQDQTPAFSRPRISNLKRVWL